MDCWCDIGYVTYHNSRDVSRFELADGQLEGLVHVGVDALRDELVEVDGAAQQLDVALLKQRLVAVGPRVWKVRAHRQALHPKPLVQQIAARKPNTPDYITRT